MARELRPIDISNSPELLRLVEEVQSSNEPRVLQRESEDVAILLPAQWVKKRSARGRSTSRGKALTRDDALWNIVGLGRSGARDVSTNKHKYLAEAYLDHTKQV